MKNLALSTLGDIPTMIRRHFRIKIVALYHTVVSPITITMLRESLFYCAKFACKFHMHSLSKYESVIQRMCLDVNNFPLYIACNFLINYHTIIQQILFNSCCYFVDRFYWKALLDFCCQSASKLCQQTLLDFFRQSAV